MGKLKFSPILKFQAFCDIIAYNKGCDLMKNESVSFSVTVKCPYYDVINDVFYLVNGMYTTSNGKTLLIKDNIAYLKESPDSGESYIIANKSFPLPQNYNPGFIKAASDAYTKMYNAALDETRGSSNEIKLTKRSAFRDYNYQMSLYNNYVKINGKAKADTFSARPGFSEHQTGYCLDMLFPSSSQNAKYKTQYDWLSNNAYKYGFILRYPEGKTTITGYIYEPWHYRYVGTELAAKLWNGGNWITMEEHFGVDSSYKY